MQTEFEFTLPRGYVDERGEVHRVGTMRLATAMDEIAPLRDPRVRANEAYLTIIL
ncbi:MAG: phage tail assembly protein, partial [Chloroflexi bacterium]|nr:phage tail assembly protein [Chloroflexota bacterium]